MFCGIIIIVKLKKGEIKMSFIEDIVKIMEKSREKRFKKDTKKVIKNIEKE